MAYDFYAAYCVAHRAVYGRDPCSRAEWAEWVRSPSSPAPRQTDIEFDYAREAEGDAQ